MPFLAQHRLLAAILGAAFLVTAGVFVFARPEYRDPTPGKELVFPEARAATRGWTWEDGTPGFQFGDHHDEWNVSLVRPTELVAAHRAAASAGVSPESLRILQASRSEQHVRPQVLLAGSDAAGRTCLGLQLHRGPVSFVCPPQLDRAAGFVLAEATPPRWGGHGMFLTGIARADVTRVTIETPGSTYVDHRGAKPVIRPFGPETVYDRGRGNWWGTFVLTTGQPGPWHALVVFSGSNGPISTVDLRFRRAGEQLAVAR